MIELLHIQLYERAGIMIHFPGCGLFAGAQPDHDIADAGRLARLQGDVTRDAITLVEQAKHRHALRHWRCPLHQIRGGRHIDGFDIGEPLRLIERGGARRRHSGLRRWLGKPGTIDKPADQRDRDRRRDDGGDKPWPHSPGAQAS